MSNDTSGPAYPQYRHDPWGNPVIDGGMTLRDYFAAKAMQAMLTNHKWSTSELAEQSYAVADAMLTERAK